MNRYGCSRAPLQTLVPMMAVAANAPKQPVAADPEATIRTLENRVCVSRSTWALKAGKMLCRHYLLPYASLRLRQGRGSGGFWERAWC